MPNIENSEDHGPSTPLRDHPSTPLRDHPSTPLRDHPSTPLRDHPSTPLNDLSEAETQTDAERQEPTLYHYAALDTFSFRLLQYLKNDDITLIGEYELYKQPMVVDMLVIKKNCDIELDPGWAKIFRPHNIIEYKSPADNPPTLAVFNKLIGYAYTYAAKEEVKISDMTATLVCTKKPEKLFETLKKDFGYNILQKEDEIYYIIQKGAAPEKALAIQTVTQKSELLLQALDKGPLDEATADEIARFLAAVGGEVLRERLGFWFRAISPENFNIIVERTKNMESIGTLDEQREEFLELVDELHEKFKRMWLQKEMQEGRKEGALAVITLLEKGYSLADAKKKLNLETAECAAN